MEASGCIRRGLHSGSSGSQLIAFAKRPSGPSGWQKGGAAQPFPGSRLRSPTSPQAAASDSKAFFRRACLRNGLPSRLLVRCTPRQTATRPSDTPRKAPLPHTCARFSRESSLQGTSARVGFGQKLSIRDQSSGTPRPVMAGAFSGISNPQRMASPTPPPHSVIHSKHM